MELYRIEVGYDGGKVVARLAVSPDAHHCAVMPGGRDARSIARVPDSGCITVVAELADTAVATLMAGLRGRVDVWGAELCGCPVHSPVEVVPLFDLVRGPSQG